MRPGDSGQLMECKADARMEWGPWRKLFAHPKRIGWVVAPTHRDGWDVRVQVSTDGQTWQDAREVEFAESRCEFSFFSEDGAEIPAGSVISATVDRAVASYVIAHGLTVPAAMAVSAELSSEIASGYSQLDRPGDFRAKLLGCEVINTTPSVGGIVDAGREFTSVRSAARTAPIRIAKA